MRKGTKGFPRSKRFGGTPLSFILAISAMLLLAYTVWPNDNGPTSRSAKVNEYSDPRQAATKPLCEAEHVRCAATTTESGAAAEYGVISALKSPSRGLVLVELGGPGLDLLAKASIDGLGLPAEIRDYDILILREPWASRTPSRQCLERLDRLGATISEATAAPSIFDRPGCTFDVWTRGTYVASLAAVLKNEKRPLSGIVGQSFGAILATQASETAPKAWLLINAAIAPPGTPANRVMAERVGTLERGLVASYARNCKQLALPCGISGLDVIRGASQRFSDRTVEDRSKPLRGGDIPLAAMAAAYDLHTNERWLWRTLSQFPDVSSEDWITLGRLSDQLLQRYGEQSISPKMGAYLAGLCGAYSGWDRVRRLGSEHPGLLLDTVASQCQGANLPNGAWSATTSTNIRGGSATCILVNTNDTVVEREWSARWRQLLPASQIRYYTYSGHAPLAQAVELVKDACGLVTRRGP